jgi:4-amino-4-deoxy-L-arabinose transferase-like glycosyltransferase
MSASDAVETGRDRAALTREAGIGKLSFISVLAGVLVAYGAFAVLAALAAAAAAAIGLNTDLSANNWAELGVGSAIVAAVVLLLAYLFGGYVAGRMARRAGLIHGLAVFVLALVIVALIAAIAATQTDTSAIRGNLRSLGIPTTGAEWSDVGTR